MIKFINIGTQATSKPAFAFFDTTTLHFFEFAGEQIWHNRADFVNDHKSHSFHVNGKQLQDFLRVLPSSIK